MTKRKTDDRYAMAETELELVVDVTPEPSRTELSELLELAERDCFIGSSLSTTPSYRWRVNGRTIGS